MIPTSNLATEFGHPDEIRVPKVTEKPVRYPNSVMFDFEFSNTYIFRTFRYFLYIFGSNREKA